MLPLVAAEELFTLNRTFKYTMKDLYTAKREGSLQTESEYHLWYQMLYQGKKILEIRTKTPFIHNQHKLEMQY